MNAARVRATLGEISMALEKNFGRYQASTGSVGGVYASESATSIDFTAARQLSDSFAEREGRRPRILIAKVGQDGHDRGSRVVATALADMGFDVDLGPLFQTPFEVARNAIDNDVHVLGISSLAAGHTTLVPEILSELRQQGRPEILVVVGGVIPETDHPELLAGGVARIYGPGTPIPEMAIDILHLLDGQ